MKKRLFTALVVVLCILLIIFLVLKISEPIEVSDDYCEEDSDCVVFGQDGDCNCGCYTQATLPEDSGGKCFCAAPTSCKCVDNKCEGVYGE